MMSKREMIPLKLTSQAKRIIEDALVLSNRDWETFTKILDNPPKPNAKLKKLLSRDQNKLAAISV